MFMHHVNQYFCIVGGWFPLTSWFCPPPPLQAKGWRPFVLHIMTSHHAFHCCATPGTRQTLLGSRVSLVEYLTFTEGLRTCQHPTKMLFESSCNASRNSCNWGSHSHYRLTSKCSKTDEVLSIFKYTPPVMSAAWKEKEKKNSISLKFYKINWQSSI